MSLELVATSKIFLIRSRHHNELSGDKIEIGKAAGYMIKFVVTLILIDLRVSAHDLLKRSQTSEWQIYENSSKSLRPQKRKIYEQMLKSKRVISDYCLLKEIAPKTKVILYDMIHVSVFLNSHSFYFAKLKLFTVKDITRKINFAFFFLYVRVYYECERFLDIMKDFFLLFFTSRFDSDVANSKFKYKHSKLLTP